MVGGSATKKKKTTKGSSVADENPETLERKRLKTLAFSNKILSQTPAKPCTSLAPSKIVAKHHGRDIVKKSQRKNRFLFSFPGLLAPISGGKIGELKDLGTKNPILYLDFPQGRMKLFGTIVYPKNRYLTLQFPRGGKNVMCEDYFDNMIVFSDAWWIGTQNDNPEESRLDFPKELGDGKQAEYDFKGGAGGASCGNKQVDLKNGRDRSPSPMLEDDSSDDEIKESVKLSTPVRQSARTAGKKFNFRFAEASPEDDSIASDADEPEEEKKITEKKENSSIVFNIDDEDLAPPSVTELEEQSLSSSKVKISGEDSSSNRGSLIQTTISTMFKKVEEKKTPTNPKKVSAPKVSAKKTQQTDSKRKSVQDGASAKKAKKVDEKHTGGKGKGKKKANESDDDDIEEFSSESQDIDDESDDDWEA